MKNNERIYFSVHWSRPKALKWDDSNDEEVDDRNNNKKNEKIIIRTVVVGRKKDWCFMFKAICERKPIRKRKFF
jgi:hypothetical protein